MNVFISWAGSRSRVVAEILRDWLKCVLQATRPWISTSDIDRGAIWFSEICEQLKCSKVGIICLTQENKNRPWLLFEAGALARGLESNRVCTLLIDLRSADVGDPLAQFNHTFPTRESMWQLVRTLNNCLETSSLDERIVEQVFGTYWPRFEESFRAALKEHPPLEKAETRSEEAILGEILQHTRYLSQTIGRASRSSEDVAGRITSLLTTEEKIRANWEKARVLVREVFAAGHSPETARERLIATGFPAGFAADVVSEILRAEGQAGPTPP